MKRERVFYSILFLFLLSSHIEVEAQKVIQLVNNRSRVKILLLPGERIKCKLYNGRKYVGKLEEITDSSFALSGRILFLDSVKSIGKRKRGIGILTYSLMAGSYFSFLKIADQANSSTSVLLWAGLESVLLSYLFIDPHIGPAKNHNLHRTRKWRLEVVDLSTTHSR